MDRHTEVYYEVASIVNGDGPRYLVVEETYLSDGPFFTYHVPTSHADGAECVMRAAEALVRILSLIKKENNGRL